MAVAVEWDMIPITVMKLFLALTAKKIIPHIPEIVKNGSEKKKFKLFALKRTYLTQKPRKLLILVHRQLE